MKQLLIALVAVLSMAATPTHDGYVTDRAGLLSPAARATLEQSLRDYEQRSTNEVAVLTVPDLGGEDIEGYSTRVFHEWGIGKKGANNGVLLVVSMTHKLRIEVGYGLEEYLPDGRSGQIIREAITPAFKAGHYEAGIMAGVAAIITQLDAKHAPPAPAVPSKGNGMYLFFFLIPIAGIGIGWIWIRSYVRAAAAREQESRQHFKRVFSAPGAYAAARRYAQPDRRRPSRPAAVVIVPTPTPYHAQPSRSYSSDSSSSSSGSSSFGGFGGGDSGGGGASGSW